MYKFLLCISFLITTKISAQNFENIFSVTGLNTNEYANTALELSNGNFLIGINNQILCLAPNGDSLWTKSYNGYGDIAKLFLNNSNELLAATTKGKMLILKIDPNNGDSIGSVTLPNQPSNSGYTIYDVIMLPDGDIIYCYNNGGGFGGIIRRLTPGQATNKWSNDYAGENWAPKNILLDDTTVVISGYKGTSAYAKLVVRKLGISNVTVWNKEMERGTYYADRKLGIQKNLNGEYLIATSFNMFNTLAPTVIKMSGNGDSLSASWVTNYSGNQINHGYLTSLSPVSGGFYAAGYLNYNKLNPNSVTDGMGHMCVFFISNSGQITQAKAYNKVGFYEYSPTAGEYDAAEGWGNGCFTASNGKYLLYGVGNKIHNPGTGANYQALWKGYVVHSDSLELVTNQPEIASGQKKYYVYPNPFNDKVYLYGMSINENIQIFISDLKGDITKNINSNKATQEIDLSSLPSGVYFMSIVSANSNQVIKLIKN